MPSKQDMELFRFGMNNIIVYKKEYKHFSTFMLTQYNLENKQNLFLSTNQQQIKFNPKRIEVLKMKMEKEHFDFRFQRNQMEQQQYNQMLFFFEIQKI